MARITTRKVRKPRRRVWIPLMLVAVAILGITVASGHVGDPWWRIGPKVYHQPQLLFNASDIDTHLKHGHLHGIEHPHGVGVGHHHHGHFKPHHHGSIFHFPSKKLYIPPKRSLCSYDYDYDYDWWEDWSDYCGSGYNSAHPYGYSSTSNTSKTSVSVGVDNSVNVSNSPGAKVNVRQSASVDVNVSSSQSGY